MKDRHISLLLSPGVWCSQGTGHRSTRASAVLSHRFMSQSQRAIRPQTREFGVLHSLVVYCRTLGRERVTKLGIGYGPLFDRMPFNIRLEPSRLLQTACYAVHLARVLLAPD